MRRVNLNLPQTRLTGWIGTVARLLLAAGFLLWSVPKLGAPREFKQAVRAFDLFPEWLAKAVAYGAPTLIAVLAVVLVLGLGTRIVAAVAAVAVLGLLVVVLQSAARGLHVDAGVFGVGGASQSTTSWLAVLLVFVELLLAVFLFLFPQTMLSLDDWYARHDYVEPPSAKRLRDPQGRKKYEAEVEAKARAARVRSRWISGSIVLVGLAVVVSGVGVLANNSKIKDRTSVANVDPNHGVVFGKAAAADVEIVFDFQSPESTMYLTEVGKFLETEVRANRAQAHYHPIANLDHSNDGSGYSSLAANAAICGVAVSPDFFVAFTAKLAANRPSSQDAGSVSDFLTLAKSAGTLTSDQQSTLRDCMQGKTHLDRVRVLTEQASRDGVVQTPVVRVNGKQIPATLAALKTAIADAGKTGPKPSPSVTPKPTPTTSTPSPTAS